MAKSIYDLQSGCQNSGLLFISKEKSIICKMDMYMSKLNMSLFKVVSWLVVGNQNLANIAGGIFKILCNWINRCFLLSNQSLMYF